MYHPSMKSMARLDASSLDLERENGTNQCETKVIPIFPFWTACIIYHLEYEVFYCSLINSWCSSNLVLFFVQPNCLASS
jgi:hypothetical protein